MGSPFFPLFACSGETFSMTSFRRSGQMLSNSVISVRRTHGIPCSAVHSLQSKEGPIIARYRVNL